MWALLVTGLVFSGFCNTPRSVFSVNKTDTVIIYKKDTVIVTGSSPVILPCKFPGNAYPQFKHPVKIILQLEAPVLVSPPEGVYELYITGRQPSANDLSASQPAFVNVLDLYSYTAPGAAKNIQVDISNSVKRIFSESPSSSSFYICIRFGPVKLKDGRFSSKAGELRFSGFRIVQTPK